MKTGKTLQKGNAHIHMELYDIRFCRTFCRERIIVPLDRHFVIYPGSAGVDEGASVDEGAVF